MSSTACFLFFIHYFIFDLVHSISISMYFSSLICYHFSIITLYPTIIHGHTVNTVVQRCTYAKSHSVLQSDDALLLDRLIHTVAQLCHVSFIFVIIGLLLFHTFIHHQTELHNQTLLYRGLLIPICAVSYSQTMLPHLIISFTSLLSHSMFAFILPHCTT